MSLHETKQREHFTESVNSSDIWDFSFVAVRKTFTRVNVSIGEIVRIFTDVIYLEILQKKFDVVPTPSLQNLENAWRTAQTEPC